jgi:hypothetical protein
MIQGEIGSVKSLIAVLALVLVPQKDIATSEGWAFIDLFHVIVQCNHTREWNFQIYSTDRHIWINVHHCYLSTKNGLDSVLPGHETDREIAKRLI